MPHRHGHRFHFELAHKLDGEERRRLQPPDPMIDALGLAAGQVVLELGAGTGFTALPIAAKLKQLGAGRVIAADIEPRMLERVTEKAAAQGLSEWLSTLLISEEAPSAIPLNEASVDRALQVNLYHELPDRPASVRELRRCLKSGGRLLVVDWDPAGTTELGPPAEYRVAPEQVERELAAEFSRVERLALFAHHYALLAS